MRLRECEECGWEDANIVVFTRDFGMSSVQQEKDSSMYAIVAIAVAIISIC